jgi:hypothetical protein
MLDVHPPHAPTHSWRDFFIHIATIVVGLLIAIGLEQTVEFFHHRHQLHQLEQSLDKEVERNHRLAQKDIAELDDLMSIEERNKVAIQTSIDAKVHGPLSLEASPLVERGGSTTWAVPTAATLTAARYSGTLSLVPQQKAVFLARLEFTTSTLTELSHQLFDAEYRLRALSHLHADPSAFTPEERHDLLVAVSELEETAMHTRLVLLRMNEITPQDR